MPTGCQLPVAISNVARTETSNALFWLSIRASSLVRDGSGTMNDKALYVMWAVAREFCPELHTCSHNKDQTLGGACGSKIFLSQKGKVVREEAAAPEEQRHSWYFDTSNRHTSLFFLRKDSFFSYNSTTSWNGAKLKTLAVACCQPLRPIWQLTSLGAEGQFYSKNPFGSRLVKVAGGFWGKPAPVVIRQNSFLLCKVPSSKELIAAMLQSNRSVVNGGRTGELPGGIV